MPLSHKKDCIIIAVAHPSNALWVWTKTGMKRLDQYTGPRAEMMDEEAAEYARRRLIQVQEDGMVITRNNIAPFKYHIVCVDDV